MLKDLHSLTPDEILNKSEKNMLVYVQRGLVREIEPTANFVTTFKQEGFIATQNILLVPYLTKAEEEAYLKDPAAYSATMATVDWLFNKKRSVLYHDETRYQLQRGVSPLHRRTCTTHMHKSGGNAHAQRYLAHVEDANYWYVGNDEIHARGNGGECHIMLQHTMCMLQICVDVGYGKVLGWDILAVHALPSAQEAPALPREPARGNEGHWQTNRLRTRLTGMGEQPTCYRSYHRDWAI
jgi:hypothetical protein